MSHLQLLESLFIHLMIFKKRKYQKLRNTSTVSVASGKKRSNDMWLPSFDSRIYHQRGAKNLDLRAIPISKNTLATKFPHLKDGEYNPLVTYKPRAPCQQWSCNGRDLEYRMTRIEKINLNHNWGQKESYTFQ